MNCDTVDLDGQVVKNSKGMEIATCIGEASIVNGKWRVLVNLAGALVLLEVKLTPDPRQWNWDH